MPADPRKTMRMTQAGLLAWILPGAGHFWLGQRGLGIVYFVAISFAFGLGAAVGGVKTSVNPAANKWLFLAELGVGSYTFAGYATAQAIGEVPPEQLTAYQSFYPESDIAQIYLATAGLLNLLAILDALARAQSDGKPVFEHENVARDQRAAPSGSPAP